GTGEEARGVGRVAGPDKAIRQCRRSRRCFTHDRARSSRVSAWPFWLRQDDNVATDCGVYRTQRGRNSRRRPTGVLAGKYLAARTAQYVDDLPELRALATYDGRRKHRLWLETEEDGPRYDRQEARRHSWDDEAGATCAALPRRIVGRTTAACCLGACTDRRARDAAARRAAFQSRCK